MWQKQTIHVFIYRERERKREPKQKAVYGTTWRSFPSTLSFIFPLEKNILFRQPILIINVGTREAPALSTMWLLIIEEAPTWIIFLDSHLTLHDRDMAFLLAILHCFLSVKCSGNERGERMELAATQNMVFSVTNTLPTPAGDGHQWTIPTSRGIFELF